MKRKIISILLIISLVIQCVPQAAMASQGGRTKTPDEIKNEANNGIDVNKQIYDIYDNGDRTIDFKDWVISGYDLDTSKFTDTGNIQLEDTNNLIDGNATLDWSNKVVKFKLKDTADDTKKINITIPLKKTDLSTDTYNIKLNVTVKNTKIAVHGKYDGTTDGFKYSAKQLEIARYTSQADSQAKVNKVYYDFFGDENDLKAGNIIIGAEWYNKGEEYQLVGAPPINKGKYEVVLYVKTKEGKEIASTNKIKNNRIPVDINKKQVEFINLAAITKPYDGTKDAEINYDAAKLDGTVGGETLRISEESKKLVRAKFDDEFVGTDKKVTLYGDGIHSPYFKLIDGTGLASNYDLKEPTAKGTIQSVKRTIVLNEPDDKISGSFIVSAQSAIDENTFAKKLAEIAIEPTCLDTLRKQKDNLKFVMVSNGQEVPLQGQKIELGKKYRIRVYAPNVDLNNDAQADVKKNEYDGSKAEFVIVAKEEAKKITITKSKKIEYTGIAVNITENSSEDIDTINGLNFKFDGARPFYAWFEKDGAGWKQLADRPVKPGIYKVEATSSNAGQVSATASEIFEIEKKGITIQSVDFYNRQFVENYDAVNVNNVMLGDNSILDKMKYNILDATVTDASVGKNKKVDLTIELIGEGAECYMFKDNGSSIISLKDVLTSSGEIVEAPFSRVPPNNAPIEINVSAKPDVESYLDLTDYLCFDFKIDVAQIKIGDKFKDGQWKPILGTESKGIKFSLKKDAASTQGDSTITIPVKSANYIDYDIIINVTPETLDVPKVLFRASNRIMYNGGKAITFKNVKWGQSFSPIVDNGVEYMYSGDVTPQVKWYEAKSDGTFDGVSPTSNVPSKAGSYKLELEFAATSKQAKLTVTKYVVVEERVANIVDFELGKKTYDKTNKGDPKDVTKIVFKDSLGSPITDIQKSETNGYSVDYISYGKASVGKDIPVMIQIHLNGLAAKNYTLKRNKLTLDKGEIIKATHKVDPIEVKTQIGKDGEADLSKVITDNAEISIDLSQSNDIFKYQKFGNETTEKPVHITDNKLIYTIKDVDTIGSRKEGTVILNVKDPNYEDYAITIKVKATSQDVQEKLYITCGSALKFGDSLKLSYKGGSGTGAVTFKIVEGGTGEAHIRENKEDHTWYLDPIRIGKVEVYAVKAADDRYAEAVSSKQTVTISKGVAKGTPTFTPVVKPGVKLGSVELGSNNMIPPGGEFKWSNTATTIIEKGKAYKWTYTPADKDKDNYASTTGEVVLYEKDDPDALKPGIELPTNPSSAAGKDSFGMTVDQQANNKVTIESLFADILQGVEHTVPADSTTKKTESAIQKEMKAGAKIKIKVEARRIAEGQVSADATKLKTLLDKEYGKDKYTVVQYGAIVVKAQTEDKHIGNLTELNQKLAFTIQLPSQAYGYYHMARMHNGKAELLDDGDVTFDPKTKRVTFYADRFSTYMLFRTGQGGGDIPGEIDPDNPNIPGYPGGDPNDPNNPNNPNYPGNKPGYIYPVTNLKLASDHGLIKVSFTKSKTKNIKYYSVAYRPMKRCTCGRWHFADKKGYKYKGIKGTVTTLKLKKNVPYKIRVAAVTDYGSSVYVTAGVRYANRVGTRSSVMYDPHIYSAYSKKGSRSMTIKVRKIKYSNQPSPIMYQYFYKRKGTNKWYSVKTRSNVKTIKKLRKGKTYSIKVRFYYKSRLSSSRTVYSKYDYDSVKIR